MKKLLIFAAILVVCSADESNKFEEEDSYEAIQNKEIENEIRDYIEAIRIKLKEEGIPKFEIDSFDPLDIEYQRYQLETPIKLDVNVTQLTHGLLDFEVTKLDVQSSGLIIDFALNWPSIFTHCDYGILMISEELVLFGNGDMNLPVTNLAISGHMKLSRQIIDEELLVQIEEMSINLSVDSMIYEITGYMNDEEASKSLSDSMTATAPGKIKAIETVLNKKMPELIKILNQIIVENTLSSFGGAGLDPLDILSRFHGF